MIKSHEDLENSVILEVVDVAFLGQLHLTLGQVIHHRDEVIGPRQVSDLKHDFCHRLIGLEELGDVLFGQPMGQ